MKHASTKSIIALTVGKRFYELVILNETKVINQRRYYLCQCDCGNQKFIRGDQIRNGKTKSCCKRFTNGVTHGMRRTRFYNIWSGMKNRIKNPDHPMFRYYGGRGLTVSVEWEKFDRFKEDMLPSYLQHIENFGTKNTQIDRINNNKGYEQKNCRWATIKEQRNNQRRSQLKT